MRQTPHVRKNKTDSTELQRHTNVMNVPEPSNMPVLFQPQEYTRRSRFSVPDVSKAFILTQIREHTRLYTSEKSLLNVVHVEDLLYNKYI